MRLMGVCLKPGIEGFLENDSTVRCSEIIRK